MPSPAPAPGRHLRFGLLVCALVVASIAVAADAPSATTGAAKDVGAEAGDAGRVRQPEGQRDERPLRPRDQATSYGLASAPRTSATGPTPVSVEIPVQGLSADTTYHFRVVATSDGGTVQGADATFRTASAPDRPRGRACRPAASGTWPNAATLTASVDPNNASTSYKFQYGGRRPAGRRRATGSPAPARAACGQPADRRADRGQALPLPRRGHQLGRDAQRRRPLVRRGLDRDVGDADRRPDPVPTASSVRLTGKLGGSRVSGVRVRLQTTTFPTTPRSRTPATR